MCANLRGDQSARAGRPVLRVPPARRTWLHDTSAWPLRFVAALCAACLGGGLVASSQSPQLCPFSHHLLLPDLPRTPHTGMHHPNADHTLGVHAAATQLGAGWPATFTFVC